MLANLSSLPLGVAPTTPTDAAVTMKLGRAVDAALERSDFVDEGAVGFGASMESYLTSIQRRWDMRIISSRRGESRDAVKAAIRRNGLRDAKVETWIEFLSGKEGARYRSNGIFMFYAGERGLLALNLLDLNAFTEAEVGAILHNAIRAAERRLKEDYPLPLQRKEKIIEELLKLDRQLIEFVWESLYDL